MRTMKRPFAFLALVAFALSACTPSQTRSQEPHMTESPMFTGLASKPLNERVDVAAVQDQLHRALADARAQIDTEFGQQEWTLIEGPMTSFNFCESEGRSAALKEGLTFNLDDKDFTKVLSIVAEKVSPIGFTEVVDVSDSSRFAASIYNTTDGGWVRVGKAPGQGLSISFETGCRPLK